MNWQVNYRNKSSNSPVYAIEVKYRMKKTILYAICITILLSTAVLAKPDSAFACSCAYAPDPESQVKSALERDTVIFAGTVKEIKEPRRQLFMSTADLVKVTFEVSEVWKGEADKQTSVYTAMSSASCGYEDFNVGTAYIVTAHSNGNKQLETGICELTKPLASAKEEAALLGDSYPPSSARGSVSERMIAAAPASPPEEQNEARQSSAGGPSAVTLVAAFAILIAGTLLLWLADRRKNQV